MNVRYFFVSILIYKRHLLAKKMKENSFWAHSRMENTIIKSTKKPQVKKPRAKVTIMDDLKLSDEAKQFIIAGASGRQMELECHFCGITNSECHLYVVRKNKGMYRGYCTHISWSGKPWCSGCFTLGKDSNSVVHPSCAKCCGLDWGRVKVKNGRLEQWNDDYEEIWEAAYRRNQSL